MSHICTEFSPFSGDITIGEFYQVERILDIALQFAYRHMGFFVRILELTSQSAAQHRKRFRANLLRKLEKLIESQPVALIIVGIKAVGEGVLPAILVQRTVLYRPH